jgi:glycosyltransferase involved in cell wall biosynthesis
VSGRPLRIALLGGRGIPARYGGFETLLEELAPRLLERGFEVTVYCRAHNDRRRRRRHKGVHLVHLPTIRTKHLETPVHTLLSALHAAARGYDAALLLNGANVYFVPILRAAGIPVALNVDGIERRRAKWGLVGRSVYALAERLATLLPDRLVTDARTIHDQFLAAHGAESESIAYGVAPRPLAQTSCLRRLGLEPRGYFLYVSRFEPENNPHRVVEAYREVPGELPLVLVGGAPYAAAFVAGFSRRADPRVRFPGAIYGRGYRQLLSHAYAYVHATEVGGTHPALVEAMGYGNCVAVNDTPENREVAGDAARYFRADRPSTLAALLAELLRRPEEVAALGRRAAGRARALYSWDEVADRYARLFAELAGAGRGAAASGS